MISPLEIYLVLQLDSIISGLIVTALFSVGWACGTALHADSNLCGDAEQAGYARARRRLYTGLVMLAIAAIIPSTKTAAAMLIVPAVMNNETVQKEAGELYTMAKDALKEAVKPEESK